MPVAQFFELFEIRKVAVQLFGFLNTVDTGDCVVKLFLDVLVEGFIKSNPSNFTNDGRIKPVEKLDGVPFLNVLVHFAVLPSLHRLAPIPDLIQPLERWLVNDGNPVTGPSAKSQVFGLILQVFALVAHMCYGQIIDYSDPPKRDERMLRANMAK